MGDSLSEAITIVFGVLVFIIALSTTMYIFDKLQQTGVTVYSNQIVGSKINIADSEDYFVGLSNYTGAELEQINTQLKKYNNRIVTKADIVPMLYRYYRESFAIKIYDKNGNLKQVFDKSLEDAASRITGLSQSEFRKYDGEDHKYDKQILLNTFGNKDHELYMFKAPWRVAVSNSGFVAKDRYTKDRVELYVSGSVGIINGIKVDYASLDRNWFSEVKPDVKFRETIVKYNYSGDVEIAPTENDNYGTDIVRSSEPLDKIEIIYREI